MPRRTAILLGLLAVPLLHAPAAVASSASSPEVRLAACDATDRTADFEGDMRTVAGASRLQMRFSLLMRAADGDEWVRVAGPRLDTWLSAQPGRSRYVYTKHVENLQAGAAYRVSVRFRWRAADGSVLRTVTRRSHSCVVPDPRPDLVPMAVDVRPGAADGRSVYLVTVANRGRSAAPATSVAFDVGTQALPDRPLAALQPRDRAVVAFDGPACAAGTPLVVTVDATGLVDEALEADDVLTVPCPAPVPGS
jgi:hypothetical protein